MMSGFEDYFMVVTAFGIVIIFIVILKSKLPKPKYENVFAGGKIFPEEMFKRFEKMRKENNPNNEPVGKGAGRCQFCGSTRIDQKWKSTTPFNHEKEFIKNCNFCNFVVDSM